MAAAKHNAPHDYEPDDEPRTYSVLEVIQTNQFLAPAGIGVAIVVILLLTDSPYAWVATFSYFLLGLPGLIIYLSGRARPPVDQSWRYQDMESEADRVILEKLKGVLNSPKFPHPEEVERAIAQYERAFTEQRNLLVRVRSRHSPELVSGQKVVAGIMARLKACVQHCSQLTTIDPLYLMRRVQAVNSKSQTNEYDQVELQSLQSKLAAREQLLHDLIDALRANDRALAELAGLAKPPLPKAE